MLNLKKTALAVIALGSTAAFAGTMGPVCSAVNVTVPCENTAWDLGGRALYLQPSSSAGLVGNTTVTAANGNTVTAGTNPQWGWGFQLEGSYHFSTGNDFNLNWYHFRNSNSRDFYGPLTASNVVAPFTGENLTSLTVDQVLATGNAAWDQVNMEFGQHVDFGENKFARFHGGMNFSRVGLNSTVDTSYSATPEGSTTATASSISNTRSSVFNGFGPRVGMDLTYDWGNGLSVYADGALSVLAGSSKSSTGYAETIDTALYTGVVSNSASNVVGELDAKLGAMYTYAMAQGDLSLDIGWVFANYMNALQAANLAQNATSSDSAFGIQGLYFGLKWVGNVA